MTAPALDVAPQPCTRHPGQHWHVTFLNRDGCTRYATTTDPARMRTPAGWTFLAWGWWA